MILLTALALLAGTPTSPTPLAPSGKWVIDYREMSCVLSRKFGKGRNEVTLGWRMLPLADDIELLVASRSNMQDAIRGKVVLRLSSGVKNDGVFQSYPTTSSGTRVLRAMVPATMFIGIPDAVTLTVTPQELHSTAFEISGADKAFAALNACTDDTLKVWGISSEEARLAATSPGNTPASDAPAAGQQAEWLTADDYPADAIRMGAQGTSTLLWTIGVDGRVHDCRVVISSGSPVLDAAGCKAITLRGRYTPMHDAAGQPIAVHKSRRINWSIPGTWRVARGPEPE